MIGRRRRLAASLRLRPTQSQSTQTVAWAYVLAHVGHLCRILREPSRAHFNSRVRNVARAQLLGDYLQVESPHYLIKVRMKSGKKRRCRAQHVLNGTR